MTPTIPFIGVGKPASASAPPSGTPRTFYYLSAASSVLTGTTAVKAMSMTPGSADASNTSQKYGTNATQSVYGPFQPLINTTVAWTPTTVPSTKGWIVDTFTTGTTAGTYSAGNWSVETMIEGSATLSTNVVRFGCQVWKVTATTTAVTAVADLTGGAIYGPNYTPSTTPSRNIITFNPGAVTCAANEYLYMEHYVYSQTPGDAKATSSLKIHYDTPTTVANYGRIVTPAFA